MNGSRTETEVVLRARRRTWVPCELDVEASGNDVWLSTTSLRKRHHVLRRLYLLPVAESCL